MREIFGRKQFCDAEIEQLWISFIGDEDIRCLDVAVHDQIAVRIVNRRANRDEQLEALAYEQRAAVAVTIDGFAIDILHDQVRCAVLEVAAVDEARDRAMIERRQNVTFTVQSAAQPRMHRGVLQHLDRDQLVILRIVALAAVYDAHAAVAQNRHDPIGADARTDQAVAMIFQQRLGRSADRVQQRIVLAVIARQQGLDR